MALLSIEFLVWIMGKEAEDRTQQTFSVRSQTVVTLDFVDGTVSAATPQLQHKSSHGQYTSEQA